MYRMDQATIDDITLFGIVAVKLQEKYPSLIMEKDIRRMVAWVAYRHPTWILSRQAECSYHETLGGRSTALIVALEILLSDGITEEMLAATPKPIPITRIGFGTRPVP